VALDQARVVRMVANAGMPGAPPPYSLESYIHAYPTANGGGFYGTHPPPYGLFVSCASMCHITSTGLHPALSKV